MGGPGPPGAKRGPSGVARTAEIPGQTVNVDLCFVPATHETDQALPAVSGSSGRLVVTPPRTEETTERTWPGRILEDRTVEYADAMCAFVAAAAAPPLPPRPDPVQTREDARARKGAQRALRQKEMALRDQRRQVRTRRWLEDATWRALVATRRATPPACGDAEQAREAQWRHLRAQRRAVLQRRQEEDAAWRHQRQRLRDEMAQVPRVTAWIAVLVLTDNCTRQCLGLPLFVAGPKVTAEVVVEALRILLPPELQFLISDRGTHFTAHAFAQFAHEQSFVHVLIARHRPESNGIAERFVRTLKEWLATQTWASADELAVLLARFRAEYNDRPHQGIGIPGLSPTEFAHRIWLM